MPIQWFPGHMAKTNRLIAENISLCDLIIELSDARIPQSSRNPYLSEHLSRKPSLLILNKSDMADPAINKRWMDFYRENKINAALISCQNKQDIDKIPELVRGALKEKIEKDKAKGVNRAIKIMVVGIPNVGKSTFINKISGRKTMKVEDRPGVTRDKQWIRLPSGLELLDMPGILWPKFEDPKVGYNLAFTGAIKDDILELEDISSRLLEFLNDRYPDSLKTRYKIEPDEGMSGADIMRLIARKRGFLLPGGEFDLERTANTVLDEFRGLRLGPISLEWPEDDK